MKKRTRVQQLPLMGNQPPHHLALVDDAIPWLEPLTAIEPRPPTPRLISERRSVSALEPTWIEEVAAISTGNARERGPQWSSVPDHTTERPDRRSSGIGKAANDHQVLRDCQSGVE
jgi:hypothetical protein